MLAAFLAFVALVATSPNRFLYDEWYFANYIPLLHRHGLTTTFLNSLTGTVGPLYSFVHVIFEPLTELQPVRMRFVSVLLLAILIAILAAWLKRQKCADYGVASCSVLVVPMTWVVAGMALSEMSAMVFVTLSLYLQLRGLEALERERGRSVLGWFLAGGVALGIAVWGRQPYLLLVGIPLLLALLEPRLITSALVFCGAAVALALPLFVIWGGLVPPSHHEAVQQGLSLTHAFISLGYTAICFLLLAPRLVRLPVKPMIGLVAVTAIANALMQGYDLYPVRSVMDRYLPAFAVPVFGNLCGSLFMSCGIAFSALLLKLTWEERKDLKLVAVNAGLLCVAASPVFIAHQYSSRYTAMSLPYLILASHPLREWRGKTAVTAAVGCIVGFLSLFEYFSH